MLQARAVVVLQCEIDRIDTEIVGCSVNQAMRAAADVSGATVEFGFEVTDESVKEVDDESVTFRHYILTFSVDQCAEHNGPIAVLLAGLIDELDRSSRLLHGVHEGQGAFPVADLLELGEQCVTERLRGNASPVRDEEDGSLTHESRYANNNGSKNHTIREIRVEDYVIWFDGLSMNDVDRVGGKNASLGEMISKLSEAGVRVPPGFATTAAAFNEFLDQDRLAARIDETLRGLDVHAIQSLSRAGESIRGWVEATPLPSRLEQAIRDGYKRLQETAGDECAVAVRSSATAEDLPEASFAGQQETLLNVRGIDNVLSAVTEVFASLFNDRAIAYRAHQGFAHMDVALSAGIQLMVRADLGCSGVMFTLDTETGFTEVVFITSSWGLGETVVQGAVNPDEFYVFKRNVAAGRPAVLRRTLGSKAIKLVYNDQGNGGDYTRTIEVPEADRDRFSLSDEDAESLALQALSIENHYGRAMDIEWAKDGRDDNLYILQARPETVRSREDGRSVERYHLKTRGAVLASGRSVGTRIGSGTARILKTVDEMSRMRSGEVLVADMTDPDWEPVMARASAIVTNRGGRTCHAAIIARELGVPAVVGTGDATLAVANGSPVTVSCAEGETGFVYEGELDFDCHRISLDTMPEVSVKITMNVANPDRAFGFTAIPNHGIGLARLEFIINRMVGIHPQALLEFEDLPAELQDDIRGRILGYADPVSFYIEKVVEGVATIAAAFYPKPVIVRLSDFKSNEYRNLVGGERFEPREENPMMGFRGASRYLSPSFRDSFELECRALRRVRGDMGLGNVEIMVPFVRTLDEARAVIELLAEFGLQRGDNGLRVIMMCELPSNALLASGFLEYFDGFSIGSNDLTQLTLGLDRDSSLVADSFDERDEAVKVLLHNAIQACRSAGKYVGICGQGPSDQPDFAAWLQAEGIESMSLNPDSVVETWLQLSGETM